MTAIAEAKEALRNAFLSLFPGGRFGWMRPPPRRERCSTCRWWIQPSPRYRLGDCTLVERDNAYAKLEGDDACLETAPDFGCVQWEGRE